MERITQTSLLRSATQEGLFDELEKIADTVHDERRARAKKWLTNSALYTAGAGGAAALATVADKLGDKLAPSWEKLDNKTKTLIMAPLLAVAFLGSRAAGKKLMEERKRRFDE